MPNNDLISREAAMNLFLEKPPEYYHTSYIVGELDCLPSVNAALVVHGRWERQELAPPSCLFCSECGFPKKRGRGTSAPTAAQGWMEATNDAHD